MPSAPNIISRFWKLPYYVECNKLPRSEPHRTWFALICTGNSQLFKGWGDTQSAAMLAAMGELERVHRLDISAGRVEKSAGNEHEKREKK